MREAWRLNAVDLKVKLDGVSKNLMAGFYFQSSEMIAYADIEAKIKKLIDRLKQHHATTHS